MGSEISGAVSGVTTPGASRLQASQLQQRSTTMQRLHPITAAPAHAIHIPPQTSSAPMASHRHHLPRPQRPHTYLETKLGGDPWGPPPGTPRTQAYPPHPPPGARSSPSTTRHTQPGVMGIRDTHEPTSSRGHQDRTIHPASPEPNPTPQHPTRLHHLVGILRPMSPHPPTSPPPPLDTNTTALLKAAAAAASQVGAPKPWRPKYLVETKVAPHAKAEERPPAPKPLHAPLKLDTAEHTTHDKWAAQNNHPPHHQPQKRRRQDHRNTPPPPHYTSV